MTESDPAVDCRDHAPRQGVIFNDIEAAFLSPSLKAERMDDGDIWGQK